MSWGIPHKITVEINVHFDKLIVEHVDTGANDDPALQAKIDALTAQVEAHNARLAEVVKP